MLIFFLMICFLLLTVWHSGIQELLVILEACTTRPGSSWVIRPAFAIHPVTSKTDFTNRQHPGSNSLFITYAFCSLRPGIYDSPSKIKDKAWPIPNIVSAVLWQKLLPIATYGINIWDLMAVELLSKGIRIDYMVPGFIATAINANILNNHPERKQKVLSRIPKEKPGEPQAMQIPLII